MYFAAELCEGLRREQVRGGDVGAKDGSRIGVLLARELAAAVSTFVVCRWREPRLRFRRFRRGATWGHSAALSPCLGKQGACRTIERAGDDSDTSTSDDMDLLTERLKDQQLWA